MKVIRITVLFLITLIFVTTLHQPPYLAQTNSNNHTVVSNNTLVSNIESIIIDEPGDELSEEDKYPTIETEPSEENNQENYDEVPNVEVEVTTFDQK